MMLVLSSIGYIRHYLFDRLLVYESVYDTELETILSLSPDLGVILPQYAIGDLFTQLLNVSTHMQSGPDYTKGAKIDGVMERNNGKWSVSSFVTCLPIP
jgi:hypothetical protein